MKMANRVSGTNVFDIQMPTEMDSAIENEMGVPHGILAPFGTFDAALTVAASGSKSQRKSRHRGAIERLKALAVVDSPPSTNLSATEQNEDDLISFISIQTSTLNQPESGEFHRRCSSGEWRTVCDIRESSQLSAVLAFQRMRSDIKSSLLLDLRSAVSTQCGDIVKSILPPLLMALLTPLFTMFIQVALPFIVDNLIPPISYAMEPTVMLACMGLIDTALGQAVEATLVQILGEGMKNILRRALSWAIPKAMKKTLPRALAFYTLHFDAIQMAKPIGHGVVHSVTQAVTKQASATLPQAISNSVNHILMQRLQRYEYCVYCYYYGSFCDQCDGTHKRE
eukprot:c14152_g1_i3.p1 GENE.c14152_g1_i3~~c14152_g1_i3.p1  ORF type:complete len:339 (+),score=76.04 c14152_g1_i3:530-1546(+)